MLAHTILGNDPDYGPAMSGDNLRFILWEGQGRPRLLGSADAAILTMTRKRRARPLFFARKVDIVRSYSFLKAAGAPLPAT